jgi:DNA excision repair protein ERCC-2
LLWRGDATVCELLEQYFDSEGKNGFDYTCVFPGMNKVLLADDRYLQIRYRRLLPEVWQPD